MAEQKAQHAQQMQQLMANLRHVLEMSGGAAENAAHSGAVASARLERLEGAVAVCMQRAGQQPELAERVASMEQGVRGALEDVDRRVAQAQTASRAAAERGSAAVDDLRAELKHSIAAVERQVQRGHEGEHAATRLANVERTLRINDVERIASRVEDLDSTIGELQHTVKAQAAPAKTLKLKIEQVEREARETNLSRTHDYEALGARLAEMEARQHDPPTLARRQTCTDAPEPAVMRLLERKVDQVEFAVSTKLAQIEEDVTASAVAAAKEAVAAAQRATDRRLKVVETRMDEHADGVDAKELLQKEALRDVTRSITEIDAKARALAAANETLRGAVEAAPRAQQVADLERSLADATAQVRIVHELQKSTTADSADICGRVKDAQRQVEGVAARLLACEAGLKAAAQHGDDARAAAAAAAAQSDLRAEQLRLSELVSKLAKKYAAQDEGHAQLAAVVREVEGAASRQAALDRRVGDVEGKALRYAEHGGEVRGCQEALRKLATEVGVLERKVAESAPRDAGVQQRQEEITRDMAEWKEHVRNVERQTCEVVRRLGERVHDEWRDPLRKLDHRVEELARGVAAYDHAAQRRCDEADREAAACGDAAAVLKKKAVETDARLAELDRRLCEALTDAAGKAATGEVRHVAVEKKLEEVERTVASVKHAVAAVEQDVRDEAQSVRRLERRCAQTPEALEASMTLEESSAIRRRLDAVERAVRETEGKAEDCLRGVLRNERDGKALAEQVRDDSAVAAAVRGHAERLDALQRHMAELREGAEKASAAARRVDMLATRVDAVELSQAAVARHSPEPARAPPQDETKAALWSRVMTQLDELLARAERGEEARRRTDMDCTRLAAELRDVADKVRGVELAQSTSATRAAAQMSDLERQVHAARHESSRPPDLTPAAASRIHALERSVEDAKAALARQSDEMARDRADGNTSLGRVLAQLEGMEGGALDRRLEKEVAGKLREFERSLDEVREVAPRLDAVAEVVQRLRGLEESLLEVRGERLGKIEASLSRVASLERVVGVGAQERGQENILPADPVQSAILHRLERLELSLLSAEKGAGRVERLPRDDDTKLELQQLRAHLETVVSDRHVPDNLLGRVDANASCVAELQYTHAASAARLDALERAIGGGGDEGGFTQLVAHARRESADVKRRLDTLCQQLTDFDAVVARVAAVEQSVGSTAADADRTRASIDSLDRSVEEHGAVLEQRLGCLETRIGMAGDEPLGARADHCAARLSETQRLGDAVAARVEEASERLASRLGDLEAAIGEGPPGGLAEALESVLAQTTATATRMAKLERSVTEQAARHDVRMEVLEESVGDVTAVHNSGASALPTGVSVAEVVAAATAQAAAVEGRLAAAEAAAARAAEKRGLEVVRLERTVFGADPDGTAARFPPASLPPGGLFEALGTALLTVDTLHPRLESVKKLTDAAAKDHGARLAAVEAVVGTGGGAPSEGLLHGEGELQRQLDRSGRVLETLEKTSSLYQSTSDARLAALERVVGEPQGGTAPASSLCSRMEANGRQLSTAVQRLDRIAADLARQGAADSGRLEALEKAVGLAPPCTASGLTPVPVEPGLLGNAVALKAAADDVTARMTLMERRIGENRAADGARIDQLERQTGQAEPRSLSPARRSGTASPPGRAPLLAERMGVLEQRMQDGREARGCLEDAVAELKRDIQAVQQGQAQNAPLRPVLEAMVERVEQLLPVERDMQGLKEAVQQVQRTVADGASEWASRRQALDGVARRVEQLVVLEQTVKECQQTWATGIPSAVEKWRAEFTSGFEVRLTALSRTLKEDQVERCEALVEKVTAAQAAAHLAYEKASHADSLNAQDFEAIKSLVSTLSGDKTAVAKPLEALAARVDALSFKVDTTDAVVRRVEETVDSVKAGDLPMLKARAQELAASAANQALKLSETRGEVEKVSHHVSSVHALAATADNRMQQCSMDVLHGRLASVEEALKKLKEGLRDDFDGHVKMRAELTGIFSELNKQRASLLNLNAHLEGKLS
eukprot:TRINITY_DN4668_c0_g1_i3.p1 TRINITY_DN4668_c0_g1~~TRINITY_DN4668_c0_g1_i3.p1  ORF type:complete len:2206 (+),score=726.29 TRINITY_DN4668_c0_g1_i3:573-6620(+)